MANIDKMVGFTQNDLSILNELLRKLNVDIDTKATTTYVDDEIDAIDIPALDTYAAKTWDTSYLATTDGFVIGDVYDGTQFQVLCDGSSPPTTTILTPTGPGAGHGVYVSYCCPVKKNNYWKVSLAGGAGAYCTVIWVPLS